MLLFWPEIFCIILCNAYLLTVPLLLRIRQCLPDQRYVPENCEFSLVKVWVLYFCCPFLFFLPFFFFLAFILSPREKVREERKGMTCDFPPPIVLSSFLSIFKIASFLLGKGKMPSLHGSAWLCSGQLQQEVTGFEKWVKVPMVHQFFILLFSVPRFFFNFLFIHG